MLTIEKFRKVLQQPPDLPIIKGIGSRVKHMNIVPHARGIMCRHCYGKCYLIQTVGYLARQQAIKSRGKCLNPSNENVLTDANTGMMWARRSIESFQEALKGYPMSSGKLQINYMYPASLF